MRVLIPKHVTVLEVCLFMCLPLLPVLGNQLLVRDPLVMLVVVLLSVASTVVDQVEQVVKAIEPVTVCMALEVCRLLTGDLFGDQDIVDQKKSSSDVTVLASNLCFR